MSSESSSARSLWKHRRSRPLLSVIAAVGAGLLATTLSAITTWTNPADAFSVGGSRLPDAQITYQFDSSYTSAGFSTATFNSGAGVWNTTEDLGNFGTLAYSATAPNHIQAANLGSGTGALSTIGCVSGETCTSTYNSALVWNMGSGLPSSGQADLLTAVTHEMGHWFGLYHSADEPSTDPYQPIMYYSTAAGVRRYIQQDDANGKKMARPAANPDPFLVNGGFDYNYDFNGFWYGWQPLGAPGYPAAEAQYCSGGAYSGPCFEEFSGGGGSGASIYQDVADDPFIPNQNNGGATGGAAWQNGHSIAANVHVRSNGGIGSATLAIWNLSASPATVLSQVTCSNLPNLVWEPCTAPNFVMPTNSNMIRFQVYSNTTHNLDVDAATLAVSY
jgi:hypothetical protein